jgi:hypothetical protein
MPTTKAITPLEQKAFDDACNLYYLRILEGVEKYLEPANQWWPIATLCAVAIDAMAAATSVDGVSTRTIYIAFIKRCPALYEYAPFAERFYASLRSGLVHSLIPKHSPVKQQKSKKPKKPKKKIQKRYRPAALESDFKPPHLNADPSLPRRDYLVVSVPHLLACTKQMFSDFRTGPIKRPQRRFMKRFVQQIWDDTSSGLVPKP